MADARVLVVDDDPDIHALLAVSTRDSGVSLASAYDAQDALERLANGPYDLVLTDINMPGLTGLELLEKMRELCPDTPVVVMTAQNTPENLTRALRDNAFSYFSKPFSPAAVLQTIRCALDAPAGEGDIEVVSARDNWISLVVRCKLDTAERLLQCLSELPLGLAPAQQQTIAMAFRELLINAIEHGGHLDPTQKVEVSYIRLSRAILYYIRDPGEGFSFENLAHAAVSNAPDDPVSHVRVRQDAGMRAGGFGIFMTRNIADELIYNEKGNQVMLVKYLPPDAGSPA